MARLRGLSALLRPRGRDSKIDDGTRSRCDLVLGPDGDWAIEIKMLRVMGDNGKPNDNILTHILSPYPGKRSALTDCEKLLNSHLPGRKGIVVFGYEYIGWPMSPVIRAFELLAAARVELVERYEAKAPGLVHPVHSEGAVFGWEVVEPADVDAACPGYR